MPSYVFYDRATGDILHLHSESYMGSDRTVEIDEDRLMAELGELLPSGVDVGVLALEDEPRPKHGYRYRVDLATAGLALVERQTGDGEGGA